MLKSRTRCDLMPDPLDSPGAERPTQKPRFVRPPLSKPHLTQRLWAADDDAADGRSQRQPLAMIKRRGGGEGGKAVSRGEGTEGMRVESPSEETRGKVEGRDKRDLRAKVLELLVDALQSHCDEGMWYLKRGRDDLGSWGHDEKDSRRRLRGRWRRCKATVCKSRRLGGNAFRLRAGVASPCDVRMVVWIW